MPVVKSHAWLAEKLSQYHLSDRSISGLRVSDGQEAAEQAYTGLQDLVATICRQILQTDAALVAAVAARQAPRQQLADLITRTAEQVSLRAGFFRHDLQQQVMDFLFGYGPLQPFIDDDSISDIDGTGPDSFTIKQEGQRKGISLSFPDDRSYDTFCRLMVIRNGGIINENDSHCRVTDARNRLRINVTVPPRSVRHASISIRKHRRNPYTLDDLVAVGMLQPDLAALLKAWASSGQTVLFSGKGAAGKTTLLRAFIEAMPPLERILIAESDCELDPVKPCCLIQRIKKPHEGGRTITLRDLVSDGLTMSLDTYCIGEIVGDEALELIRAAFSGHRCLATIHADRARDVPERLVSLARPAAGNESDRMIRRMLAGSIDLIVSLRAFAVEEVVRVHGYLEEYETYEMDTIWPPTPDTPADAAPGRSAEPLVPGEGRPAPCL